LEIVSGCVTVKYGFAIAANYHAVLCQTGGFAKQVGMFGLFLGLNATAFVECGELWSGAENIVFVIHANF